MVNSSFFTDGTPYSEDDVVTTEYPAPTTPSQAPSGFYPDGQPYTQADEAAAEHSADLAAASAAAALASQAAAASSAATAGSASATAIAAAAGTATPLIDGTASVGTSTKWAHEDHVHPTDASRADAAATTAALALKAPLASPALTGTPTAPTATGGTNTAQLATTAFVQAALPAVPSGATAPPLMDAAAAVGTSAKWAHEDHVHPTDTSRAPLSSPTFTGTPAAPTPATSDNSTKLATTAYVKANVCGLFVVDRNGTNQTGLTAASDNKVQFTNEVRDANGWFDNVTNYRYTPLVAGTYLFSLQVASAFGTSGETCQAAIFKNGSKVRTGLYFPTSGGGANFNSTLTAAIPLNGTTDYVEAYAYLPAAVTTLSGSTITTHFQGWRIGD